MWVSQRIDSHLFHTFFFTGQIEAICMLLQQNKVQIDAKNIFGFTPLMKAAIQGHLRCAKALLLAGKPFIVIKNR